MKKQLAVLLGLTALAGGATACVDLNEEIVTGVTASYYNTAVGFDALVNSNYESLRYFYAQERGFTLTVFGTDEFTKGADGSHKFYNDYTAQLNGDQSFVREVWDRFYRAINSTNATIDRAPSVPIDSTKRNLRVAEARFLRAFYYFHLVQMYGDVPMPLQETTAPTTEAVRVPVADVYKQIIEDLQYAESKLPDTQNEYGRATRPAARHLLAKVYLTRAEPGDMAKAAEKAKEVINSNLFSLLPRYKDVFDIKNDRNREVVWSIQYTADPLTTGDGNKGHLYFLMEYDVLPGMKRDVANGRPFKRFRPTTWLLGLWDRSKDSRYEDTFNHVWYANNEATIPKDATGKPKFALGDTAVFLPGAEVTSTFRASKPYTIYTPSQYNARIFPALYKFHDAFRSSINEERGQRDYLIYRLAETYLIVAEALVRDGKADEAVPYVNAVRRRAAKLGVDPASMDVTAAQLDLDFILDERSRELAGESMRWFDLKRTGKLLERVKKYNSDAAPNIKDFHVLRPVPNTQIERTSIPFPQNPGY
jgi:starch-binding outer membrane protein, SusD/RagB family